MSELGPEARAIVEAGRGGDDPTRADRARVKRALQISLAAGAAAAIPSAAEGAAAAASVTGVGAALLLVGKVLLAITVVGAVGGLLGRASEETVSPPIPLVSAIAEGPPSLASAPVLIEPSAPAVVEPRMPVDDTRPAVAASAIAPPILARPLTKPLPSALASADQDTLEAETRRLREAHRVLQAGDPDKALALLDEQAAAYAKGALGEERAAARVLTLCKLGRTDEARVAAARFLRDNPRSPLADRVRAGCPAASAP